jgi:hypothetical protein
MFRDTTAETWEYHRLLRASALVHLTQSYRERMHKKKSMIILITFPNIFTFHSFLAYV